MPICPNCEETVTPDYVRVFGNNRGEIDGCVHCRPSRELTGPTDEAGFLPPVAR